MATEVESRIFQSSDRRENCGIISLLNHGFGW
jgi:hypothetical protein